MSLRVPPGRAGRIWLLRRLAVARRGQEVLEQKRRALLREAERLRAARDEARQEWESAARRAETWWHRAALLAGQRPLELARDLVQGEAEIELRWRNSLGVLSPGEAEVTLPPPSGSARGSSALAFAAATHRQALEAAARLGAAERAYEATLTEVSATSRRLRAIERRWLPEHEQALARLELELDEVDREDAARVRWVLRQREQAERGARHRQEEGVR